ncbi:ABC transporter ATP-binding protein [Devosia sp. A449]
MSRTLQARNLKRHYLTREPGALFGAKRVLKAVDGVSFSVAPGETLGIVGESGCGKSTTAKLLLGLLPASSGEVWFGDERISARKDVQWRQQRRLMQMIYQDPMSALDRRLTIGYQIGEPFIVHHPEMSRAERESRVATIMSDVGLTPHHGDLYPHQLSGGQRQRAVIARTLAIQPELIVCDEPVSALDVSVQAQVLNLFQDIRERTGFTSVFISHDLKVVRQVSDRVAVMYLGKIVEMGLPDEVFHRPRHPYTKALVSAVPNRHRDRASRIVLTGELPSPLDVPQGCPFHTRCREATAICRTRVPDLVDFNGHKAACHLVNPIQHAAVA